MTQEQVVAGLRAKGQDTQADMLASMTITPGEGVDFAALERILLLLVAVYLLSAVFAWLQQYIMAGVAQRTVYRLRQAADEKLARLPLRYFDDHPRGDILSRVTNDIDNIAQTLQQSLTQIITAVLTIVGVLIMMLSISWLLAVISLLAVPLSVVVTMVIAKRSQKQFAAQWERTGALNGHVEEMYTGHNIVKVFGRQQRGHREVRRGEREALRGELQGAVHLGHHHAGHDLHRQPQLRGHRRDRRPQVANGTHLPRRRAGVHPVLPQFTMPITQTASIANVLQSDRRLGRARLRAARRGRGRARTRTAPVALGHVCGHIAFEDVSFRYVPDTPLIEDLDLDVRPRRDGRHRRPHRRRQDHARQPAAALLRDRHGRILVDGVDTREMTRDDLRGLFGMVLQDAWLFGGTIRENIAYGREGATEEEILAAAEAAHVDHFVRTLPDGYDTVLDDDATSVSAGREAAAHDRARLPRRSGRSSSSTRRRAPWTRAPRC